MKRDPTAKNVASGIETNFLHGVCFLGMLRVFATALPSRRRTLMEGIF